MCEFIKINPFRSRSFASFAKLAKELIDVAYKKILNEDELEYIFSFIDVKCFRKETSKGLDEYYLIRDDNKDVGFFQTKINGNCLDITRIYLKKSFQGKKLGYKAFLKILKIAKENKLDKITIYVNNEFKKSQKAILKWGFCQGEMTARYIGFDKYLYEDYFEYNL